MPNSAGPFVSDFTEAELIQRINRRLPRAAGWVVVGIGDDAAVVEPARNRLEALSVDSLVDGVHFDRRFTPPEAIGHRALAVNLSDLAAMGAEPRLALLSLALPPALPVREIDGMMAGFAALATRHRVSLVGGNITHTSGPLVVDVTVAGSVKRRQVLLRTGARPGDDLYVTGWIGSAAAGLGMLRAGLDSDAVPSCVDRYLFPEPRIRMGLLIGRNRAATACIDLSDGLAEGVRQLAEQSGVGARLCAAAIPVETAARRWFERGGGDPIEQAVAGGDDYELLIAVRPRLQNRLTAARDRGDVSVTRIGACTSERHVVLDRGGMIGQLPRGYAHFR
jgi:thiamine-monophosphate kinase